MTKRSTYFGNPYIGLFFKANDDICIIPYDTPNKKILLLEEELGVSVIKNTVDDSNLIGPYVYLGNDFVLVPEFISKEEVLRFKEHGLDVFVFSTRFNALGNNVLIGKKCLVNPRIEEHFTKQLEDCIGIEVVRFCINGYTTIGSLVTKTSKGFVCSFRATDKEFSELKEYLGVDGERGSVNLGSEFVSLGIVANANGCIVGELTTGIEIMRIEQGLGLV